MSGMRVATFLMMATFVLVGCASDPYQQIEMAQAAINATQRAGKESEKATAAAEAQETEAALATAGAEQYELDLAAGRAQATQDALGIAIQQIEAARLASEGTQRAKEGALALQATEDTVHATATGIAVIAIDAQESAEREARFAAIYGWIKVAAFGFGAVTVLGICVALVLFAWDLKDWVVTWKDRRNRLYRSPEGVIYLQDDYDDDGKHRLMPILVSDATFFRRRPKMDAARDSDIQEVGNAIVIGPPARPLPEPTGKDAQVEAALQVVEAAIEFNRSGEAMIVPRWNKLGFESPNLWSLGTDYLEKEGWIIKEQGKMTVARVKLSEILFALQSSPTPR